MAHRLRPRLPAFLCVATSIFAASPCFAAWQTGVNYGGTLSMDLYTPSKLGTPPAVLVAIHYCTGHASSTHGWFDKYADQYGFYVIAPDAGKQCFDSSATRDGDKAAIVKMVDYVVTQKGADKTRVFAAGASSGGCMTNTLLAIYPDVFAGGSALPGFPAGGWPAGDTTCTKCGSNPPNMTGKQWGDIARNAFAWNGARPRVQEWVGGGDEYNFDGWLPAVVAQFTDLMGLDGGAQASGAPSGWTRTEYKDSSGQVMLQTNLGPSSQKHDVTGLNLWGDVVTYLGLDKPGSDSGGAGGAGGMSNGGSANGGAAAGGANGGRNNTGAGGSATSGGNGSGGTANAGGMSGGVSNGGASGVANTSGGSANTSSGGSLSGGSTAMTSGGAPSSTGGASNANGGTSTMPSAGAANPAEGGQTTSTGDSGGCSVAGGGQRSAGALVALVLAGIGAVVRRRRRTTA